MTWQAAVLIATTFAFLALWLREAQQRRHLQFELDKAVERIASLSEALSAADDEDQPPRQRARTLSKRRAI